MSVELETEINVKERIKDVVQEPGKYKVIFANDNENSYGLCCRITSRCVLDIAMKLPKN